MNKNILYCSLALHGMIFPKNIYIKYFITSIKTLKNKVTEGRTILTFQLLEIVELIIYLKIKSWPDMMNNSKIILLFLLDILSSKRKKPLQIIEPSS